MKMNIRPIHLDRLEIKKEKKNANVNSFSHSLAVEGKKSITEVCSFMQHASH